MLFDKGGRNQREEGPSFVRDIYGSQPLLLFSAMSCVLALYLVILRIVFKSQTLRFE